MFWDEDAGQCVEESACSRSFSLPPGAVLGRPFLTYGPSVPNVPNTQVQPLLAPAAELASDWLAEL